MKFKGKTNIELRNVITGVVEKSVYSENMFTDALDNIFNPPRSLTGISQLSSLFNREWNANTPIATTSLGGIMLFDSLIEESESIIVPPDGVKCVGYANQAGSASPNLMRGVPVVGETLKLPNGYKYTWTFDAQTANGDINCVALTSADGGSCGWDCSDLSNHLFINSAYKASAKKQFEEAIKVSDAFASSSIYYCKLDERDGFDLYVSSDGTYGDGVVIGKILSFYKCKNVVSSGVGINSDAKQSMNVKDLELIATIDFTEFLDTKSSSGDTVISANSFDYDVSTDSYYYVCRKLINSRNSLVLVKLTGDSLVLSTQVISDASLAIAVGYTTDVYSRGCIIDGYLYYPSTDHGVYKINLANTVDIVRIEVGNSVNISKAANICGKLFIYTLGYEPFNDTTPRTFKAYVYDGFTFKEVSYVTDQDRIFVTRKMVSGCKPYILFNKEGTSLLYMTRLAPYLATINNLASTLTKTSSQVMTITYVVEEVSVPS